MRLLVFGDSITYGAWDTEGGWVERIKKNVHSTAVASEGKHKSQVINLGIGGDTSANLLARMEPEIKSRFSSKWPLVIIIAISTNDGRMTDGRSEISIDEFENNINVIISTAKKYTDKIFLLGLPPLGVATLDFNGRIYSDDIIKRYDTVLSRIATDHELVFIPIRSLFEKYKSKDLFSYDYLHPGNNGHELIASEVTSYLEKSGLKL